MKVMTIAACLALGTLLRGSSILAGENDGVQVDLERKRTHDEKLITNSIAMKLVWIPAGEFHRGSPDLGEDEVDRDSAYYEKPQHRVRITRPFYLARAEVTQAEWQAVMGTNPSYFSRTGGYASNVSGLDTTRFPVENVSWYDAVEYCNKLSAKESLPAFYRLDNVERKYGSISRADLKIVGGRGYRLPTEAEWEYACRAGTTTHFHFGDASNGTQSNVHGKSPSGTTTKGPSLRRTTTVGSYPENAFGLVDMHGNVSEWCQDLYDESEYSQFASKIAIDPQGPSAAQTDRVLRGGAWYHNARFTRSAHRFGITPDYRDSIRGFRLARTP